MQQTVIKRVQELLVGVPLRIVQDILTLIPTVVGLRATISKGLEK